MIFRSSFIALLFIISLLFLQTIRASEILIDDFIDQAEVISPEMDGEFIESMGIGDLNATRSIRIFSLRASVNGKLDSGISSPSALTIDLSNVEQEGNRIPIISYQFNYEFSFSDFTAGGVNNALFLDFDFFSASQSSPVLRVTVRTTGNLDSLSSLTRTYAGSLLSAKPFTVVLPFEEFTDRGGGPSDGDFTEILDMFIEVTDFSASLDSIWSGKIASVRVGTIQVPEPCKASMVSMALLASLLFRFPYFSHFFSISNKGVLR